MNNTKIKIYKKATYRNCNEDEEYSLLSGSMVYSIFCSNRLIWTLTFLDETEEQKHSAVVKTSAIEIVNEEIDKFYKW